MCKEGGDCGGGQRLLDLTNAAPLEDNASNSGTVAIVLSVLFLAVAMVVLIGKQGLNYQRAIDGVAIDTAGKFFFIGRGSTSPAF